MICDRCGEQGHIARECRQPVTCNNCHGKGHLSKACPAIKCDKCGRGGHIARECTRGDGAAGTKCFECGEMGHMSYDCPVKGQRKRKLPPELVSKQQELGQFARERAKALSDDKVKRKLSAHEMLGAYAAPKGKAKVLPGGAVLVKKKDTGVVEEEAAGGTVMGGLDSLAEYGSGTDSE